MSKTLKMQLLTWTQAGLWVGELQYINGHFCFAQKAVVVANGLGIVHHLELFDDDFKAATRKRGLKSAQSIRK